MTESLSVMLRGFTEEIDAMDGTDLTVTVDLGSITQTGTYTLPVSVRVNDYQNVGIKGSYQVIVEVTVAELEDDPDADPEIEAQNLPATASLEDEILDDEPQTNTNLPVDDQQVSAA